MFFPVTYVQETTVGFLRLQVGLPLPGLYGEQLNNDKSRFR